MSARASRDCPTGALISSISEIGLCRLSDASQASIAARKTGSASNSAAPACG
jgi:hypothetical protein